jgi:CRISPR-associated endonuclease/helicase Cas3
MAVYDQSLLIRTHQLLAREDNRRIAIPEGVQALVDGVYDEEFAEGTLAAVLGEADVKRFADEEVQQQLAQMIAIPSPRELVDLHRLTDADVDEELIATRLGADSVRILCCFADEGGQMWLDPDCRRRLPESGYGPGGRFTAKQIRELLAETIPVRSGSWTRARGPETQPPAGWRENPWLRDLVLLPHPIDANGAVRPVQIGDRQFQLDPDVGLIIS